MQTIPRDQVRRRLEAENPWWAEPHELPAGLTSWLPRPYLELFLPLVTQREVRRAVVLMGPRRVGKTVLIHHSIQELLRRKMVPGRIGYVSLDNPIYVGLSLQDLAELFAEATGTDLEKDESLLFFDEVQYLRDWERHLKVLVDGYPALKCVASGSAAAALRLKSNESGAGRFTEFLLPPLNFHEYLALLGAEELVRIDRGTLVAPDIEELNRSFVHYLNFGGYPEAVFSPAIQADPARFIKSDIIDKVLLRDLPSLYGIRDIQELNALFTTLAYNTAEEISLEQLASSSGVAKNTLRRYIEYLEAAFLIRAVQRVDKDARHFQRAGSFKIYPTNPSIRTALFSAVAADDDEIGSLVETGVFAQWFHSRVAESLHYARWKEGEIDIVSLGSSPETRWAVEVKWSDRFFRHPDLLGPALSFCQQNGIENVWVTTRTQLGHRLLRGTHVDFVPAALYAYQVGYNLLHPGADLTAGTLSIPSSS